METYSVATLDELSDVAEIILAKLGALPSDQAVLLTLQGELGAGKTAFVQQLGRLLGVEEAIVSPTFVIMKQYVTTNDRFASLIHMDAYRLADGEETKPLHLVELLKTSKSLVCIEWAELIEEVLPKERVELKICDEGGNRTITVNYYDSQK